MKIGIWAAMLAASVMTLVVRADEPRPHPLLTTNKILDASIYNNAREAIGDVDTIILDKAGKALFVIAGVGGVAGVGESQVVVPWSAIQFECSTKDGKTNCYPKVALTAEQLRAAPTLKAEQRQELSDAEWLSRNAKFYSVAAPSGTSPLTDLTCVRSVTDAEVLGSNRQAIGYLDAMILDLGQGRVIYGVIGHGGVAGVGKTYTAVPFKSLTITHNVNDKKFTVAATATPQSLETGPRVTPEEYPELELKTVRDRIESPSKTP